MSTTHSSEIAMQFSPTDEALIDAYCALKIFTEDPGDGWRYMIETNQPKTLAQAEAALLAIESALSIPVLATILPAYTKVRYTVNGSTCEGQLRDGAWGLHRRSRTAVTPRRVTTTMGWEFWFSPELTFDAFEILERAK